MFREIAVRSQLCRNLDLHLGHVLENNLKVILNQNPIYSKLFDLYSLISKLVIAKLQCILLGAFFIFRCLFRLTKTKIVRSILNM